MYVGNTDGTLYAFGASTGHLLWSRDAGTYIYSDAAVSRRKVIVGTYDGYLVALNAATGSEPLKAIEACGLTFQWMDRSQMFRASEVAP